MYSDWFFFYILMNPKMPLKYLMKLITYDVVFNVIIIRNFQLINPTVIFEKSVTANVTKEYFFR